MEMHIFWSVPFQSFPGQVLWIKVDLKIHLVTLHLEMRSN